MSSNTISIEECRHLLHIGRPMNIIDVRTPAEFAKFHVAGARLIPLDALDPEKAVIAQNGADAVYVICHSGARAAKACERLRAYGIPDVYSIEGGAASWERAGLPVERGDSRAISMERQVRIAAGALVVLGVSLALIIHWAFLIVPLVVGAGLVFAGITDTCGMAIALGKMPWNRRPGPLKTSPAS